MVKSLTIYIRDDMESQKEHHCHMWIYDDFTIATYLTKEHIAQTKT